MTQPCDDFRSDTLTRPTDAMRKAMARAEVGDDVFSEDPTINRLEQIIADLTGKESAIYVPSGTMSNLIGMRLHGRHGDEFLCEEMSHIIQYEQAGYAQVNGLAAQMIPGDYGLLRPDQFEGRIRPGNIHAVRTRFVLLENTHNRGGGRIQPYADVEQICRWAHDNGLTTHMDGARLFNAVVATGISAERWSSHFDTVSICFSKGLGAPVGSALCGPKDWIDDARRHRKVLGGGMRQAGVIAAGAIYALENHIDQLADDHVNALRLGDAIRSIEGLSLAPDMIDTNMVFFEVDPKHGDAASFCEKMKQRDVQMLPVAPQRIRAVTHLDVDTDSVDRAIGLLRELVAG